jgi:membrane protein DedA with SNARE-associated domain
VRGQRVVGLIPRSKYLFVAAATTFAVGALEATGVVEIPFAQWFATLTRSVLPLDSINAFMSKYGYASLFALMGLESASLPVPSELVLPLAGALVYEGTLSFWPVVAVGTAAGLAGALVDYYIAAKLGRPFISGLLRAFHARESSLERAEGWFKKSGQWTVFAARFVPVLRTLISFPAGIFKMKLRTFSVLTLLGCFAWTIILVYAGMLAAAAGQSWNMAFASSPEVADLLSGVVAAISAAYLAYYLFMGAWGAMVRPSGS